MSRNAKFIFVLIAFALIIPVATYLFLPKPKLPKSEIKRPLSIDGAWKVFTSKRFTVELPGQPHHAHETSTVPDSKEKIGYDMYVTQSRLGTTFMINVIEYPPSFNTDSSEPILTAVLNDIMAANDSNTIIHKEYGSFFNYPSIEFVLNNTQANLRVRAFLRDKTLFILSVADTDIDTLDGAFSKFVESFQLKTYNENSSAAS
jgi:hypothetical protein